MREASRIAAKLSLPALYLLLWAANARAESLAPMPTDLAGLATGAVAVGVDPAFAGRLDGPELMLRRGAGNKAPGFGSAAIAGALPFGAASLSFGLEKSALFGRSNSRGSFGLAWQSGPSWQAGWALRRYAGPALATPHWSNDVAVAWAPSRWLRGSLGLDGLGPRAPVAASAPHLAPRIGLAVRPLGGREKLTVAASAQWLWRVPAAPDLKAAATLALRPGLSVLLSGARTADRHLLVSAGLELAIGPVDAQVTAAAYAGGGGAMSEGGAAAIAAVANPSAGAGRLTAAERFGMSVRLSSHGPVQPYAARPSEVRVRLEGDLSPAATWLWQSPAAYVPVSERLRQLAVDRAITRVVLDLDALSVGAATGEELVAAIGALRAAGKEVVARLTDADARAFGVAASCSRIDMDPTGQLDLSGFASTRYYFAPALAKLGLRVEALSVGRCKTGADTFATEGPRPCDANNRQPILDHAAAALDQALAARGLAGTQAQAVLDEGLLCAERALELGLIDAISPPIDVALGRVHRPQVALLDAPLRKPTLWARRPTVVVVPIKGLLGDVGLFGTAPVVDEQEVAAALWRAHRRPEVVAIVLRIDSPGGDAAVAERLWRTIREVGQALPVYASLGDVAASGGYYLAAGARRIVAEPGTVTGSIGVYELKLDASELLGRLGIAKATLTAGAHADWQSLFHPWSPSDRARRQQSVERAYDLFVSRVAAGRQMATGAVLPLAEGRVWLGREAVATGLVDALGGIEVAMAWAREQAELSDEAELELEVADVAPRGLRALTGRLPALSAQGRHAGAAAAMVPGARVVPAVRTMAGAGRVLALWPEGGGDLLGPLP